MPSFGRRLPVAVTGLLLAVIGFAATFGLVFTPGGAAGAATPEGAGGFAGRAARPTRSATPGVTAPPPAGDLTLATGPAAPMVWFSMIPQGGMPLPPEMAGYGVSDFMQLFQPGAPWASAAGHVSVFKFHTAWVLGASDSDLRTAVQWLVAHKIAIAIEAGALTPTAACGTAVEGYMPDAPMEARAAARRIAAMGGNLGYIAMDEPFTFGSILDRPNSCHWSAATVAAEVAKYIASVQSEFPNVQVGDIESDEVSVSAMQGWLAAYRAAAGANPAFVHWDVNWQRAGDWTKPAFALEEWCRSNGIPFGMIYFGNPDAPSAAAWLQQADDHAARYESLAGGRPDQAIFQSWHFYPRLALPESSSSSFSWLINRYFARRTAISGALSTTTVSGVLRDSSGKPISGAAVEVLVSPTDGPGIFGTYALSGTVPAGAVSAVVGVRVNTECGCSGAATFNLYGMSFTEKGGPQLIPNGTLGSGQAPWGGAGTGMPDFVRSDRASGNMFRFNTAAGQTAMLNSGFFSVHAGASFTWTVQAKVAPASLGSGSFVVVFVSASGEILRQNINLEAAATRYTATTSGTGAYTTKFTKPSTHFASVTHYAGNATYRPAYFKAEQ